MLLQALGFVWTYSSPVAFWDDWMDVAVWTGAEPITREWLWQPVGEHRIPLQRLVIRFLVYLTGDLRSVLYFSVVALGGLAFAMIWASKTYRVRISFLDAFFPLVLLHLGHYEMFSWVFQIQHTISTVVIGIMLLALVLMRNRLTAAGVITVGIGLILLPLCGGGGLVYLPGLWLWFVGCGVVSILSARPHARRDGFLTLAAAGVSLLVLVLYFRDLELRQWMEEENAARPPWGKVAESALRFATNGFGPAAAGVSLPVEASVPPRLAPGFPTFWPISGLVMLGLAVATLVVLFANFRQRAAPVPTQSIGMIAFVVGCGGLALVTGLRRTGIFHAYYSISAALFLCWAFFIWGMYRSRGTAYFGQLVLFTLMAMMISLNSSIGLAEGKKVRTGMSNFEEDLRDGVPKYKLMKRHARTLYPPWQTDGAIHTELISRQFDQLHEAGVKPFSRMKPDPPFNAIEVVLVPETANGISWEDGTAHLHEAGAYLTFALPEPKYVGVIEILYTTTKKNPPFLEVFWKRRDQPDFTGKQSQFDAEGTKFDKVGTKKVIVWIDETIDRIKIQPMVNPNGPTTVKISKITLLAPAADTTDKSGL
jgi:hypothetical protein